MLLSSVLFSGRFSLLYMCFLLLPLLSCSFSLVFIVFFLLFSLSSLFLALFCLLRLLRLFCILASLLCLLPFLLSSPLFLLLHFSSWLSSLLLLFYLSSLFLLFFSQPMFLFYLAPWPLVFGLCLLVSPLSSLLSALFTLTKHTC